MRALPTLALLFASLSAPQDAEELSRAEKLADLVAGGDPDIEAPLARIDGR